MVSESLFRSTVTQVAKNGLPLLLVLFLVGSARPNVDEEKMGRREKPTNKGPDKGVPGFLVNLGPTGARAILKETSFVVKYVFTNSPASGKLKIDDEILGVNGVEFATKHVFGLCYGVESKPGIEGPIMDFGEAIEESEGGDGVLTLHVRRAGEIRKVDLQLTPIGRFSDTYPLKCRKSDKLRSAAAQYLLKRRDWFKAGCQTKATAGLALLALGKHEEARELALSWNTVPGEGTWTWPVSYQCVFLCEYYLKTGDKQVLKTIERLVPILYDAQVMNMEDFKERMHGGRPQGRNFLKGGLGHVVKIDGYGTMSITTLMAMLAWELAEDCGVKLKQNHVDLAYECVRTHTHPTGYMGYRFADGAYSPVGRQGLSIIVHKLAKEAATDPYVKRVTSGLTKAKHRLNDGHGDNVLSMFWALLGIQVSDDRAAIREVFDYNKAFINMSRTHDGSFVAQPGRNNGDKGYYLSSRAHLTAAMVLILGMDQPQLRIQGLN